MLNSKPLSSCTLTFATELKKGIEQMFTMLSSKPLNSCAPTLPLNFKNGIGKTVHDAELETAELMYTHPCMYMHGFTLVYIYIYIYI